jgi:hypothetical protein
MIQKSPDNLLETWVGLAAIWGAITGTLALVIQLLQHLADRPKLVLRSSMGIKSDAQNPKHHLYVRLEIVNNGGRSARVERIAVMLPESTAPIIPRREQSSTLRLVSSEFVLFDAETKGRFIEIPPGGGKHVHEQYNFPENTARVMFQEQKEGKAFIRLTSGKKLFTTFFLIDPDDLLKLG